jgi:quercetin dioxygenase-like cupin family protein
MDAVVVDLLAGTGMGPLAGVATGELNLTSLAWPPGRGQPLQVNSEREVAIVVADGGGTLVVDGVEHPLRRGVAVVVPIGAERAVTAGPDGIRYCTIHRLRGGLQIAPPARP